MREVQNIILWVVMGIAVLVLIWAVFQYVRFYKKEHFVCPTCGYAWKPPVKKMIFAVNAGGGKIIRCPKCGKKDYMEPVRDGEAEKKKGEGKARRMVAEAYDGY